MNSVPEKRKSPCKLKMPHVRCANASFLQKLEGCILLLCAKVIIRSQHFEHVKEARNATRIWYEHMRDMMQTWFFFGDAFAHENANNFAYRWSFQRIRVPHAIWYYDFFRHFMMDLDALYEIKPGKTRLHLLQSIENAFIICIFLVKNNGLYHDRRARIGAHHKRVARTKKWYVIFIFAYAWFVVDYKAHSSWILRGLSRSRCVRMLTKMCPWFFTNSRTGNIIRIPALCARFFFFDRGHFDWNGGNFLGMRMTPDNTFLL